MSVPPLTPPTNADVAAILRARTKDLDGNELGVFNANTRPTDTEVDRLIQMAYDEVTGQTGVVVGDRCAGQAQALIAVRAAMWIESSYWPEQLRSDRSQYSQLAEQWEAGLPPLLDCVQGNVPGVGGTEGTGGYRFGVLDVHGWTASPYYGAPKVPNV